MKYLVALLIGMAPLLGFSQLQLKPLKNVPKQNTSEARVQAHTITLPFWDDFSWSSGEVDTTLWLPGSQVQVITKTGIGIDPPTLNVATFDGVDALGIPYLNTDSNGEVDSLISQPIDLTQVPVNLRNTVYLSFFYETKGLGEAPEEEDSLILYMKDSDGAWNKVWPANSSDTYNTDPEVFTEKFVQVNDPNYYHDEFQFMFRANGKQNGWFDNWLIDYVYMDKRRSSNDNSYLDRAFTSPPSSIFDQYTAIPFDDFVAAINKESLFDSTMMNLRNFEEDIQVVEYSAPLYDMSDTSLNQFLIMDQEIILDSASKPGSYKKIKIPKVNSSLIDTSLDSLGLMLEYFVSSGDKYLIDSIYNNDQDTVFYNHINLRVNDTTRAYFNLHDYYAYDDGTAEFGAGINQPQGKIAYQYQVITGKYLDRIDIYFPNIDGNQAGYPLELFVLNDFEGTENSLRTQSNIAITHTGINEFVSYTISPAIYVTDTFFIGITNLSSTDNWIGIGLDKNTDSYDKIFVNLDGSWVPNTDIHGSLMMRPHFTDEAPVTGLNDTFAELVQVYPNPSFGTITIKGAYQSAKLLDLTGREIPTKQSASGRIEYSIQSTQLLVLVVETAHGLHTQRILANPSTQ